MEPPRADHDLPESVLRDREELRRRARAERVHPLWLWIGIVTGPLAFVLVRTAGIVLVSQTCSKAAASGLLGLSPSQSLTAGITLLGALVTTVAGVISWRIWRRTSLGEDEVSAEGMPRVPFWALGGTLLSAFFVLAIAVTGILAVALSTSCP